MGVRFAHCFGRGFVLSLYLNYGNVVGEGKGVKVFSLVFSFCKKRVWVVFEYVLVA